MVALCGNTRYIDSSDSVTPSHSLHDELKHSVQFRKKTQQIKINLYSILVIHITKPSTINNRYSALAPGTSRSNLFFIINCYDEVTKACFLFKLSTFYYKSHLPRAFIYIFLMCTYKCIKM